MRRIFSIGMHALALVLAATVGAGVQSASAYWTGSGQGSGSAGVSTLSAPTITGASPGAETVELSWSPVIPPGGGAVEYYVSRDGGSPDGCPSASARSTLTSCTDTHVALGSHRYVVTAVWRSWSAAGAEAHVTVAFGPATHLVLEASSTTPVAGEANHLTITAKDAANNTVGTFTGAHDLLFEGASESPAGAKPTVLDAAGAARSFGEATEIMFTEGKATVSGATNGVMSLYKAETAHVIVKEGSLSNGTGLAVTVKAGAAKRLSAATPTEQTAGTAITLTLSAYDEYGNAATGYAGSKSLSWSGPGNSPSGHAPEYPASATTVTFTSGVGKPSGIKLYDAAVTVLTVTDGSIEGSTGQFTVKAAATKKLTLAAPSETVAGTPFSVTLSAYDEYGNAATAYAGSKTLSWSGPGSSPGGRAPEYPASATTVTFTGGVGTASELDLFDAVASVTLTVKEGTGVKGSATLAVKPAAAKVLSFNSLAEQTAGNAVSATLTAHDEYGNTATGYAGSKSLSWSGPGNSPSGHAPEYPASATTVTFTSGVGKPSGIKLYDAAPTTLTVKEGASPAGSSSSFSVKPGAVKHLAWSEAKTEPANRITSALCLFECVAEGLGSEGKFSFQVSVTDEWGNPQPSHGTGSKTVKLSSSCSACLLSATTLTIAEGASTSPEATFTGAANNTWTATVEAVEGTMKATASLKH